MTKSITKELSLHLKIRYTHTTYLISIHLYFRTLYYNSHVAVTYTGRCTCVRACVSHTHTHTHKLISIKCILKYMCYLFYTLCQLPIFVPSVSSYLQPIIWCLSHITREITVIFCTSNMFHYLLK